MSFWYVSRANNVATTEIAPRPVMYSATRLEPPDASSAVAISGAKPPANTDASW